MTGYIRNYYRQRQLADNYEWLSGKKADALFIGNPDLYMITKKDGNSLVIGLWNRFSDPTENDTILLGEEYASAKLTGVDGKLLGDKIILSSPIPPFGFALIELKK